ncbi:hypothetical protein B0E38_01426 [Streptomyces sp. 111WW2]|nr:hypothetical protein B0E38_01426 [Streptomyces sp. 111WW2]
MDLPHSGHVTFVHISNLTDAHRAAGGFPVLSCKGDALSVDLFQDLAKPACKREQLLVLVVNQLGIACVG